VKNMFNMRTRYSTGLLGKIPGVGMLIRKSKEMLIAVGIEYNNSKEDILRMYANTVDFGQNSYGIKTAARTYFNTTPDKLDAEQSAVLVGLLKGTSSYNPRTNPERSKERRNLVLEKMRENGYLSDGQCAALQAQPLRLDFKPESARQSSVAPYFRAAVEKVLYEEHRGLDPEVDGLKIYTTLDSRVQRCAEEAVKQQMRVVQRNFDAYWSGREPWRGDGGKVIKNFVKDKAKQTNAYAMLHARYPDNEQEVERQMNKPHKVKYFTYDGQKEATMSTMDSVRRMLQYMHTGFVAIEPHTGKVRAWVGDVDFATWQHDNVLSPHQTGSVFKACVYATAMERGFKPMDEMRDEQLDMPVYDYKNRKSKTWTPRNSSGNYSDRMMTLREAFARSTNTIAVRIGTNVGLDRVVKTARQMGIRKSKLENAPSLPLGSSSVSLLEMVSAYCCIANNGRSLKPVLIERIVSAEGVVLYEAEAEETRALHEKSAFYMQQLLRAGVCDPYGTSRAFKQYVAGDVNAGRLDVGGKTGTTNENTDAWFIGVTPHLVAGTWVGGQYRAIHYNAYGSSGALPTVGTFFSKVLSTSSLRGDYVARYTPISVAVDTASYGGDDFVPGRRPDSDSLYTAWYGDAYYPAPDAYSEPTTNPVPKEPKKTADDEEEPPDVSDDYFDFDAWYDEQIKKNN